MIKSALIAAAVSLLAVVPVWAQDRVSVIDFSSEDSINFPAEDSLNLSAVATIEFWVEPGWKGRLGYDPVILSAFGPQGPRYAIVMKEDKRGVGLYSGHEWDYVAYDFDDGRLHHVSFQVLGDLTDVHVDGEHVGSLAQGINDVPMTSFHVGSINGIQSAFKGRLGGIRLWDTAVDPDEISQYSRMDVLSRKGLKHPELSMLVGVSDFDKGARSFTVMALEESLEELYTNQLPRQTDEEGAAVDAALAAGVSGPGRNELAGGGDSGRTGLTNNLNDVEIKKQDQEVVR